MVKPEFLPKFSRIALPMFPVAPVMSTLAIYILYMSLKDVNIIAGKVT